MFNQSNETKHCYYVCLPHYLNHTVLSVFSDAPCSNQDVDVVDQLMCHLYSVNCPISRSLKIYRHTTDLY